MSPQSYRIAWFSAIFFVGVMAAMPFQLYWTLQNPIWQAWVMGGVPVALSLVSAYSAWLAWHNRSDMGTRWLSSTILIATVITSLVVDKIGVIVGLAGLLLILMTINNFSKQKEADLFLGITIFIAILASLSSIVHLPSQAEIAEIRLIIPLAAGGIFLLYFIFIVRQFDALPLRNKLIATFIVITLAPLGSLTAIYNYVSQETIVNEANRVLLAKAEQTAETIDGFIGPNLAILGTEARSRDIIDFAGYGPAFRQSSRFAQLQIEGALGRASFLNRRFVESYALLDSSGQNIFDTDPDGLGRDESQRDYFQRAVSSTRGYVSYVQFFPEPTMPSLYFSHPVLNDRQELIGVLRVRYDAAVLQSLVRQNSGAAHEKAYAILIDESRIRLADGAGPEFNFTTVTPLNPVRIRELQAADRLPDLPLEQLSTDLFDFEKGLLNLIYQPDFVGVAHPGQEVEQGAVVRLTTNPAWLVAYVQAQSVFLVPIETQIDTGIVFAVGIGTIVTIAAIAVSRRLARPIIELTGTAEKVASGNLQVQAEVRAQDEVGQLATAFNLMTSQLQELISSLEDQVRARTAELALSMEVGQRASAIRQLDELLFTITEFIRDRFEFRQVQVYLVDDTNQNLVLRAGAGELSRHLLKQRYTIPIETDSIVCWSALQGEAFVAADVLELGITPTDPETRSELALPLIVEERVIGVLDLQHEKAENFTPNNLIVFEAMATQLAISIDGAQQWAAAQEAQERMQRVIGQLTHEAWRQKLAGQKGRLGFTYDLASISPLDNLDGKSQGQSENGEIRIAKITASIPTEQSQALAKPAKSPEERVVMPIMVQNALIGEISVKVPPDKPFSAGEKALLTAVAQQLAQRAETIRLFEATQRQAAREQLARQISDRVRASRDIETALKTVTEELSKALGTARAVIDLRVTPPQEETRPDTGAEFTRIDRP